MATAAVEAKIVSAAEHDTPIPYMQRTRDYYQALGFNPYRWAHFAEVPFTPLAMPLGRARVGADHDGGAVSARGGRPGARRAVQRGGQVLQGVLRRPSGEPDLRISHVGYDRLHTSAKDINTYFPLARLQRGGGGRAGSASSRPRFHGAPTNRSQRVTMEPDAPELLRALPRRRRRRRRARAQLTRLPPDRESGRPAPRGATGSRR